LEKVAEEKEHPEFRLLVGRLYNADVNATVMQKVPPSVPTYLRQPRHRN
jgi:hypothetical protein